MIELNLTLVEWLSTVKQTFNKVWMEEKRQIVECILKTSCLIKSTKSELLRWIKSAQSCWYVYLNIIICWTILSYCPTPILQTPQHSHRRQGSFRGHRYQLQTRRLLSRSSDCGSCMEKTVPWEVPRSPLGRSLVPTVPQRKSRRRSNDDRKPVHTVV